MSERFFVEPKIQGETAMLAGSDAHHLAHVMRAKPGDEVTLFDGSGAEFRARVDKIGRSEIALSVLTRTEVDRERSRPITLAVALPKGDRARWLVEKAVELGVSRLLPLVTERSNDRLNESGLQKLRRAGIEACKQCRRNRLLDIEPPGELSALLARMVAPEVVRVLAHPGGEPPTQALDNPAASAFLLAVGPEGGFTEAEAEQAREAGWRIVGLGPRILRVETAALALVALCGPQD